MLTTQISHKVGCGQRGLRLLLGEEFFHFVFVNHHLFVRVFSCDRIFDGFNHFDKIPSRADVSGPLGYFCVFWNFGHVMEILLFDFFMYGDLLEDRVEFLQLKAVRSILPVLLSHISWCARHATGLMLCAFENDLVAVAFRFLCHLLFLLLSFLFQVDAGMDTLSLESFEILIQTKLVYIPHGRGGYIQFDPFPGLRQKEVFLLQIR